MPRQCRKPVAAASSRWGAAGLKVCRTHAAVEPLAHAVESGPPLKGGISRYTTRALCCLWRDGRRHLNAAITLTKRRFFVQNIGPCLLELNVFRIGLRKRFPKGGEHSREEGTRSPLGAVSSVTRVVLAWRPQNKRCLLGSADRAGF